MKLRYAVLAFLVATGIILMIYKPWRGGILVEEEIPKKGDSPVAGKTEAHSPAAPVNSGVPQKKTPADVNNLKKNIQKLLTDFPGDAGVVFYDYQSGESILINPDEPFESASLIKIPIMYEIFLQIQEGTIPEDKELVLEDGMKTSGAGVLKDEPAGTKWKIRDLISLMITRSDNTACDMLIELAGMENVEKTAVALGAEDFTLRRKVYDFAQIDKGKDNYATPRDMLAILRAITEDKGVDEKYRNEMIAVMKKQTMRDRIPRLLPKEAECANKTGGLTGFVHDCAIIYPPGQKPYLLILMGKNITDEPQAKNTYANISLEVYKYCRNNTR